MAILRTVIDVFMRRAVFSRSYLKKADVSFRIDRSRHANCVERNRIAVM
jgi:hypothetical protein